MKKNINDFRQMKKDNIPVSWITSYNYWQGKVSQDAGIDMILCGDSYGNVECGYTTTNPVSLEQMLQVTENVRRGANETFIIGDYPFGSYESSNEQAIDTAVKFIKAGADAIKLERATQPILDRIKSISDIGILVCGHLGVTPQTALNLNGNYRCVGKTIESFNSILKDAIKVQNAGASFLLLEGMPEISAQAIANRLYIPVYGIGTGANTDGVLTIFHDLCGLFPDFRPYFGKCFIEDVFKNITYNEKDLSNLTEIEIKEIGRKNPGYDGLYGLAEMGIRIYIKQVKERKFPSYEYTYPLKKEELEKLMQHPAMFGL